MLCQFSDPDGTAGPTLADYVSVPGVYPAGRLDKNSEGLLLLTNNGALQHKISHPKAKTSKEYWVQLEGKPGAELVTQLRAGTTLADGFIAAEAAFTLDSSAQRQAIDQLGPHPGNLPTHRSENSAWVSISLTSGRNRIVRRFCSALGHPVLRLVRMRIGNIELGSLGAGEYRSEDWP